MTGRIMLCLFGTLTCKLLSAQKYEDSVFTMKGAVTLINSKASIATFQLGDGKNTDYDYRIVDNTMVFIRTLIQNPKPTNLVIREGGRTHFLVISNKEHIDLNRLKYTLPDLVKTSSSSGNDDFYCPAVKREDAMGIVNILKNPVSSDLDQSDTTLITKIAMGFARRHKAKRSYRKKDRSLNIGFAQAMTLSGNNYFHYRIKDRNGARIELRDIHLILKKQNDTNPLIDLPVTYWKSFCMPGKSTMDLIIVTTAKKYMNKEQLVLLFEDSLRGMKSAYYLNVKAVPQTMKM